jgi:polyisoprenoid-binding protein YceI
MSISGDVFMHKKLFIVMLLALLLAACGATTTLPQPAAETATPAPAAEPTAIPTAEAEEASATEAGAAIEATGTEAELRTFTIAPDRSQVRFIIDEVLRGNPTTVVGANSGVTGEVVIDLANPANTQISPISVDAAGFITDDDRRNNAIRRFILQTGQYPMITFVPTEISGLPTSAAAGNSFDFQVTGDLTILNSTNSVTFDLTANVISENELQISGDTTINRGDYAISIPSVPFVASVDEDLSLELDLVALANSD